MTESRRASIDIFLKAAGYLDCAVRHVLPQLPTGLRFIDGPMLNGVACGIIISSLLQDFSDIIKYCYIVYRKDLPVDLAEGVLRALCLQALGQVLACFLDECI